eukprot:COSAG01_NODE_48328_length_382_cov_0.961131_1_plen_75_part_10
MAWPLPLCAAAAALLPLFYFFIILFYIFFYTQVRRAAPGVLAALQRITAAHAPVATISQRQVVHTAMAGAHSQC